MNLSAIGLVCASIQQSIQFYEQLGLKFQKMGEGDHYEAVSTSGFRLMLDSEELMRKIQPDWSGQSGRISLAFEFKEKSEVDLCFQKLTERGGYPSVKEPWDAFWGQRYAVVRDPDGHSVDLFANLTE